MKRILALLLILTGAAMCYGQSPAQSPAALIQELTGTVEIKKASSAEWVAAKAGDSLEKSTIISTGLKSMALLAVGSSKVTVKALTRLSLEELMNRDETEAINIGLRSGRVQLDIKAPTGSKALFTVQAPPATASVRGTVFDMAPMYIAVKEGSVVYRGTGEPERPVRVQGGQSSKINENGRAVNPYIARESERAFPALAGQAAIKGGLGSLEFDPALVAGERGSLGITLGELVSK